MSFLSEDEYYSDDESLLENSGGSHSTFSHHLGGMYNQPSRFGMDELYPSMQSMSIGSSKQYSSGPPNQSAAAGAKTTPASSSMVSPMQSFKKSNKGPISILEKKHAIINHLQCIIVEDNHIFSSIPYIITIDGTIMHIQNKSEEVGIDLLSTPFDAAMSSWLLAMCNMYSSITTESYKIDVLCILFAVLVEYPNLLKIKLRNKKVENTYYASLCDYFTDDTPQDMRDIISKCQYVSAIQHHVLRILYSKLTNSVLKIAIKRNSIVFMCMIFFINFISKKQLTATLKEFSIEHELETETKISQFGLI